jgi:hypothetical protein
MSRYLVVVLIFLGMISIITSVLSGNEVTANAVELAVQLQSTPDPQLSINDNACLECHGQPGLTLNLENGDVLELYVNPEVYQGSIHGRLGYACVQCHRTVGDYPHPPFSAQDQRDAALQLYESCKGCHISQYDLTQDSVHGDALSQGMLEAAICTDCHTAHAVRQLTDQNGEILPDNKTWIPTTCAQCHNAIYEKYADSVHGSALIGEGNPDVPSCIDCHGVHNIEDPTTAQFRLRSPEICSKCHTDASLMAKYGLSTQVLTTYVSDFHGTTVTLFRKLTPDARTNTPVCYDCHGIHDIKRIDDPEVGIHLKENLLIRCQECHPDATINFPDSWLSHYTPSAENASIVYYVDLFYKIFIPVLLGGMLLLVILDLSSRARKWYRKPDQVRLPDTTVSITQESMDLINLPPSNPENQENPDDPGMSKE